MPRLVRYLIILAFILLNLIVWWPIFFPDEPEPEYPIDGLPENVV
jgi:hypothetical protein